MNIKIRITADLKRIKRPSHLTLVSQCAHNFTYILIILSNLQDRIYYYRIKISSKFQQALYLQH